jgi:hypothetical protein
VLGDADRIRNLLGRYAEAIDAGDLDAVGALFARGALAGPDGTVFARGTEEVVASYRSTTRLHEGSPRTHHLVVGSVFDDPDADGSVVVRSSYLVLQAVDGLPLQPIISGRYRDRFARDGEDTGPTTDGGWHFVERRFSVELVGDLSRHLADPGVAGAS